MPYLNHAGTLIYYESHGSGPPLVFVHGMYGNHAVWFQQVSALAITHHVITLDLRGFGLSGDEDALDVNRAAQDIEDLLDELSLARVTLIAQSFGGNSALTFALKNPHRLVGLVLAGTLGGVTLPNHLREIQRTRSAAVQGLSTLERMLSADYLEREPARGELFSQLLSFNRAPSNLGPRPQGSPAAQAPSLEQLSTLGEEVGILFHVGEEDVVQPAELVMAVTGLVPNAALETEQGAGHSVYFEKPEAFNARLVSFVARVMGEAGMAADPGRHAAASHS